MIKVEVADQQVLDTINHLITSLENPRSVYKDIGEYLVDSTKRRFATSTAPDGTRWASNSQVTILQYLAGKSDGGKKKGYFYAKNTKKDPNRKGKLAALGIEAVTSKRPLIREGTLSEQISYKVDENGDLLIGSPMGYAAVQHFGAKQYSFEGGKTPWGDIPARPFLGISDKDKSTILGYLSDFMLPGLNRR